MEDIKFNVIIECLNYCLISELVEFRGYGDLNSFYVNFLEMKIKEFIDVFGVEKFMNYYKKCKHDVPGKYSSCFTIYTATKPAVRTD